MKTCEILNDQFATKQAMAENAHKPEKAEPCCSAVQHPKLISLSEEHSNLISVANKVFGEGKWSHTVVKQILDFQYIDSNEVDSDNEYFDDEINVRNNNKYSAKCVSYIKIQLENGNCYEDDGFYIAEESTEGLSMQNARIGSTVSALKKVLLSFGDKVERELQQLQRQISSEQVNTFAAAEPMDLAINFHDLISVANKIFGEGKWNHTVVRQTLDSLDDGEFSLDEEDREKYCAGCVSYVKIQLENGNFHEDIGYFDVKEWKGLSIQTVRISSKIVHPSPNKTNFTTVEHPKLISLSEERRNLISVANKVFGEGKWSHTVVKQTLEFDDVDSDEVDSDDEYFDDEINARKKYRTKCVSYIKIQLENGKCYEDNGFYIAEESTKGLSIQIARMGSAINVLKRVLLSFGDKIERELQQLQRQISSGQVNPFVAAEPMDLAINFHDLISVANKVFGEGKWNHTVVHQTLDFNDVDFDDVDPDDVHDRQIYPRDKYCAGCVSYVKIQLENGNFHEDIGYINADEGLSIQTVRIGSAIDGLFRVLLSFGDKVERELKQLRRQIGSEQVNNTFTAAEPMDLAINFHDVISVANKVFGEGKWNHTVVRQILDFDDVIDREINARNKYCAGCVSYVQIQLENGNFHEDVGYFNAEESTRSLSIHNARIGSAVNALKRVLLSFGDKVERELQQLQRQSSSDQEPMDLATDFPDLISVANKVFGEGNWNYTVISQTLGISGSAVNALKRVLLSFGDKVKRELQKLRRKISSEQVNMFATAESTDLATNFPDLISAANKVFGEGKWNHTIVSQTLEFDYDINYGAINARGKYHVGCVSSVKVQLENGNFHEDVGYFNAEEPTRGLSIYSARIGSAVNALKRVLMSFGEQFERELQLQQRQRQISPEQSDDVQRDFDDVDSDDEYYDDEINARNKYQESTKGLSIQTVRIGSAVNALKRVLLSFGDKVERELQQLQRQIGSEQTANKVFGEGNWSHTVVKQTLDLDDTDSDEAEFDDLDFDEEDDLYESWVLSAYRHMFSRNKYYGGKYYAGCVSYVKVQLKNSNFHEDVGYFNAAEPTRGLSIHNARIGSAVNALKRVLLSFGEKIERELQQLQRQVVPKQVELENGNFHEDIGYYNAEELTEGLSIQNATIGSAVNALKSVLLSFGDKIERELQQLQRQISSEQVKTFAAAEPMNLATDFFDLISAANKVFGEGKWNHTVVSQTLNFDDEIKIGASRIYRTGCVSFVKVQLESGNFHEDVGYFDAEALKEGLSLKNARIGSAVNALKRVLLSFGDKVERELQRPRRQIGSEQVNTIEPMDLIAEFPDLISAANRVFGEGKWSHTVIKQTLDFDDVESYDVDSDEIDSDDEDFDDIIHNENVRNVAGCVSYVKVQVENGNFHEDVGYCSTEEPTRGLSILNAKIGSAVNALKRVLLSFGEKVERELQRQIRLEQTNDVQDVTQSLDKQILEKLNVSDPTLVPTVNNDITETDPSSFVKVQSSKIGSAVNALKRVLLSFGDKIERELQQLQRQISSEQVNTFDTAESTDLATNFPDLISAANIVFGESKWNHTVVSQTLDLDYVHLVHFFHEIYFDDDEFDDIIHDEINARNKYVAESTDLTTNFPDLISAANKVFGEGKWNHTVVSQTLDVYKRQAPYVYRTGCVSFVKVQLENGNFHEDVGYFNAEEPTRGLSIHSARIGSAVNALKRVLMSFGEKVERELQRQINLEQTNDVQDDKYYGTLNAPYVYRTGCVSFVKVQLENGNFHEDIGYYNAEEFTQGLSIHSARIGSAVNALKRVLLSFGDKVERERKLRRQIGSEQVNTFGTAEPTDLATNFPDLISAANKVFGEGKWNHTGSAVNGLKRVLLSFGEKIEIELQQLQRQISARNKYVAGCVSYVKVQFKNENFHVDVGYCSTKEPTRGLAKLNAKIGSAINALKRVLMSFGEQFERELQQLQRQISPEQTDDVQRDSKPGNSENLLVVIKLFLRKNVFYF
ncbi:hypothetical protein DBV15_09757 [Temnothorax longispinosus]|uniref:Uncharacterized protein n=1 Tax=Temnothorax longispinosus TaxID=300112 RepID=A0A4S2L2E9_9HYME|nr:hypothetical protein DBV15_09757 [Temnothorax longispinosus]